MKKFPRRDVIDRVAQQLSTVAGGDLDGVHGGMSHAAYAGPSFRDDVLVDDDYWKHLRRGPKTKKWPGITVEPTETKTETE
jgi:hypothetical protein